jgi:hypothetical protein
MAGHAPIDVRAVTFMLYGTMIRTRGDDIRLVSIKYLGKVPKYMYARGAVVS